MPVNMNLKSNTIIPCVKAYLSMFFLNTSMNSTVMNTTELAFIGIGR